MKSVKVFVKGIYLLLLLFNIALITYIGFYLFNSTIDGQQYGFFETAWSNAKLNYFSLNGRWSQGLTNDYRFYYFRGITVFISNCFLVFSIWFFFKNFLKKNVFIFSVVFYFTFLTGAFNLFQITHLLNTSLSYTFGIALLFVFYGFYIQNTYRKIKEYKFWLSILILIFLTGLVEHLFLLNISILGFLCVFNLLGKENKFNKNTIIYLIVSIAGSLVTILSPGLSNRREITKNRNQNTDFEGFLDVNRFLESLQDQYLAALSFATLIFAVFIFFHKSSINSIFIKTIERANKAQKTLIGLFLLLIPIFPILLGFLASNGKVGMPKAFNIFSLLILLCIMFAISLIPKTYKVNKHLKSIIALIFPLFIVYNMFFVKTGNLYRQQDQVFSGKLQEKYFEEYARRQYLLETSHLYKTKYIPYLSNELKGTYGLHKHPNRTTMYYRKAFNNNIDIFETKLLPPPRQHTSIFMVENNRLKEIFKNNKFSIYFNNKLKTIVFKGSNVLNLDKIIKEISVETSNYFGKSAELIKIETNKSNQKNKSFYAKYPNYFALSVPINTTKIVMENLNFSFNVNDDSLKKNINYDFNYNNLMR